MAKADGQTGPPAPLSDFSHKNCEAALLCNRPGPCGIWHPKTPQKCLRLNPDVPIWVSKQQILCTLNHSLKDVLNYGLFQPAFNGRAGKFLDEERLLREYPLNPDTPVPYLEFRYKRRVYTQSLLDDKQFAKLHTKETALLCSVEENELSIIAKLREVSVLRKQRISLYRW
uniref:Uncharacterized protein n=1 Tax=Sphaerodactylus townsendi TaxID=933632 RepID=A0ACB8FM11_9SAUR